jgi:hypothetical protein
MYVDDGPIAGDDHGAAVVEELLAALEEREHYAVTRDERILELLTALDAANAGIAELLADRAEWKADAARLAERLNAVRFTDRSWEDVEALAAHRARVEAQP